ncbi:MAG: hypothetical protein MUE44_25610 [Oscillatoriaceae cyanobacterium Prado104]|nr:hypothetical protein [Oscillatoriaceae cyanobacterium Prado104]
MDSKIGGSENFSFLHPVSVLADRLVGLLAAVFFTLARPARLRRSWKFRESGS